jgi:hypothetical protein
MRHTFVGFEIVLIRFAEPRDFFVTVGEEAMSAHPVGVIPDDEIRQTHRAVLAHMADNREQVAGACLALVLQPAEDGNVARRRENTLGLFQPCGRPFPVVLKLIPVRNLDVVRRIADNELHRLIGETLEQFAAVHRYHGVCCF